MRIGELARSTGISERALRYYEEQGLLRPVRLPSGYREYQEADIRRVHSIRTLLSARLNTATIAEVLPCMADNGEMLVPACAGLAPVLTDERDRLDAAVADLLEARRILDAIVAAAAGAESTSEMCPPAELAEGVLTDRYGAGRVSGAAKGSTRRMRTSPSGSSSPVGTNPSRS